MQSIKTMINLRSVQSIRIYFSFSLGTVIVMVGRTYSRRRRARDVRRDAEHAECTVGAHLDAQDAQGVVSSSG